MDRLHGLCLAGLAGALITIVFFSQVPRWEASGDNLVTAGNFASVDGWRFNRGFRESDSVAADGRLHLVRQPGDAALLARQAIAIPAARVVLVHARDIEVRHLVPGEAAGELPVIALIGRDASGRLLGGFDNIVFRAARSQRVAHVAAAVIIPIEFHELWIEIEFAGGGGSFSVGEVAAFEARPLATTRWLHIGLFSAWVLLAGVSLIYSWRASRNALAGIVVLGVLLLALPEDWKNQLLGPFAAVSESLSLDHALLFLVATLIAGRNSPSMTRPLMVMVTLATVSESLQYFTAHRDPLLADWFANLAGITAGATLLSLVQSSRCRKRS